MNSCANQEATRAQDELDRVYKNLLAKTSGQPQAAAKIKTAEKAWLTYREAYLDAMYPAGDKQSQYGTIYPMDASLLRASLTRQHISDLKQMFRQYNERK